MKRAQLSGLLQSEKFICNTLRQEESQVPVPQPCLESPTLFKETDIKDERC